MSKRVFFINDNPIEVRTLLKVITKDRLYSECSKRGFPVPTDTNKFCVIVTKGRLELCYFYFKKPTPIIDLDPLELPHKGWRVYVG